MSNLPKIGVRAVVDNLPDFRKSLESVNAAINKAGQAAKQAVEKTNAYASANKQVAGAIAGATKALEKLGAIAGTVGGGQMQTLISQVLSLVGVSGVAATALAALGAAILAAGIRGGEIKGVADAFDRLTESAGLSSKALLGDLRTAARSTITDFNLMKTTNLALAGATGEFATLMATSLPRILQIAQTQAKATGQSVQFLFESLVTGIKRGSPLLIDNTGLVLKLGEANDAYAKSMGKTVEEMTAQEKQIAILNATLDAGSVAINTLGTATLNANTRFGQLTTMLQNIVDQVSVALEPIANVVLNVVNTIVGFIGTIVTNLLTIFAPIIETIMQFVGIFANAFGSIVGIVSDVINQIGSVIGNLVETFVAPIQLAIELIDGLFGGILGQIGGVISSIIGGIGNAANHIIGLARLFAVGGARLMGALAGGIVAAANAFVLPAIRSIAEAIASFLVGLSPPPKGPLHYIDKGGANVMQAWLEGFLGVGLEPVERVAGQVASAMGNIATASREQVESRLKHLDLALAPFQNRLKLVKAQFDALKEPVDAAFRAIDRQLEKAVQALANGDANAAALVRSLDAQRGALEAYQDAQQEAIDNAQIQLSLAQSQQAVERAMLEIRKDQLGPAEKVAKAVAGAVTTPQKEKKGGGGGGGGAGAPAMDIGAPSGGAGDFKDMLKENFAEGIVQGAGGEGAFAQFNQNVAGIDSAVKKIQSVDIGAKLAEKFKAAFDPGTEGSLLNNIKKWFEQTFDPANEASIFKQVQLLGTNLVAKIGDLWATLDSTVLQPVRTGIIGFVLWLTNIDDPTSLPGGFKFAVSRIPTAIADLASMITTNVVEPIKAKVTEIKDAVFNFFAGSGDGTLSGILDQAVSFFAQLPARIGDALSSVGQYVVATFVNPIIDAINNVINAFEQFINDNIIPALRQLGEALGDLGSPLANLKPVSFGRVARAGDGGGGTGFGAKGGIFSGGALTVGERGREVITPASKLAVFPNTFVRSVDALTRVLAQPMPTVMPGSAGDTTNTYNDGGIHATFNNVRDSQDAMRRLALLRALR